MTSDSISLLGVEAFGHHGVLPEERRDGQPFLVDVELHVDLATAASSDDLDATVDYAQVATAIVAVVEGEPCQLIETVADRIAQSLLRFEPVASVRVTVHKPRAPIGVPFRDVSVTMVRSR
jgi:dihydroneopterin aldolase